MNNWDYEGDERARGEIPAFIINLNSSKSWGIMSLEAPCMNFTYESHDQICHGFATPNNESVGVVLCCRKGA